VQSSDAAPPEPIVAELSGCDAFTAAAVCEVLPEQELRIAVHGAVPQPTRIDGAIVTPTVTTVGTTSLLTLRLPAAPRSIAIGGTTFALAPSTRPSWLRDATTLRKTGKLEDAAKIATAHLDDPGVDGARAKGLSARIALARGDTAAAIASLRASIPSLALAGRLSEEADDRFALSWVLSQATLQFEDARRTVEELEPRTYADGHTRSFYYRALAHAASGDVRTALSLLDRAQQEASRLGLTRDARDADEQLAIIQLDIGRNGDARRRLQALAATGEKDAPCLRADRAVNLARATRADGAIAEAATLFNGALEIVRTTCASELRQANIHLELAKTAADTADFTLARTHLDASRAASKTPRLPIYLAQLDLEGQLALASGHPKDALRAFDREEDVAKSSGVPHPRWAALLGRAEALEALGRGDDARDAYLAAEAVLDDVALLIPIAERRAAPFALWRRSAVGLVDLLVRRGRHAEAFEASRRAHARTLRGLVVHSEIEGLDPGKRARWDAAVAAYRRVRAEIDEAAANDWTATASELGVRRRERSKRELASRTALDDAMAVLARTVTRKLPALRIEEGTRVLSWHATRAGAVAFVVSSDGVRAQSIPSLDRADVEKALLASRAELEAAKRVRMLPDERLLALDLHAIAWDGVPLAERVPVEYAVDLEPVEPSAISSAIVASDPDGNLAAARVEGDEVERMLRVVTPNVRRLHQSAVTSAALGRALPEASLFHFAGHARAGDDPWDSALSLSDSGRLTVADVLALPRAPSVVVLTACEAARSTSGLGLAHAFVLAGSRAAVAPWRAVADDLALEIARSMFRYVDRDHPVDPARVLRDAIRSLRVIKPHSDWAAFRVVVR